MTLDSSSAMAITVAVMGHLVGIIYIINTRRNLNRVEVEEENLVHQENLESQENKNSYYKLLNVI